MDGEENCIRINEIIHYLPRMDKIVYFNSMYISLYQEWVRFHRCGVVIDGLYIWSLSVIKDGEGKMCFR